MHGVSILASGPAPIGTVEFPSSRWPTFGNIAEAQRRAEAERFPSLTDPGVHCALMALLLQHHTYIQMSGDGGTPASIGR